MLLQNTILQQPSTPPIQRKSPTVIAMAMDVIGYVPVKALRMPECPDSLLALLFMCRKWGQKLARNEWHCYPVLVNNPWGYIPSFTRANHWG